MFRNLNQDIWFVLRWEEHTMKTMDSSFSHLTGRKENDVFQNDFYNLRKRGVSYHLVLPGANDFNKVRGLLKKKCGNKK